MDTTLNRTFKGHFLLDEKRIDLIIDKLTSTTKKLFSDENIKLSIATTFADGSSKDSMDKLSLLNEVNSKMNPISKVSFSIFTTNRSHIFLTLSRGGSTIILDGPDDELLKAVLSNLRDFLEEKVLVYRDNSKLIRRIVNVFWISILIISATYYYFERSRLVKLDLPMPITYKEAMQSTDLSTKVDFLMWKNRPEIGMSRNGAIYLGFLFLSYVMTVFSSMYTDKIIEIFGNRSIFLIGDEIERYKVNEEKKKSIKNSILIPLILGFLFLFFDRLIK